MNSDRFAAIGYALTIITGVVLLATARPIVGWMVCHRWEVVAGIATFGVFCIAEVVMQEGRK